MIIMLAIIDFHVTLQNLERKVEMAPYGLCFNFLPNPILRIAYLVTFMRYISHSSQRR